MYLCVQNFKARTNFVEKNIIQAFAVRKILCGNKFRFFSDGVNLTYIEFKLMKIRSLKWEKSEKFILGGQPLSIAVK